MDWQEQAIRAPEILSSTFRLTGKTAIVTGAGSGIGRATALIMAAAGARVLVAAHTLEGAERTAAEIRRSGGQCHPFVLDLSQDQEREHFVREAVELAGQLDVLVNVAGVIRRGPTLDLTVEAWRHVVGVNLEGTVFLSQLVARHMVARGTGGAIVNVSSIHAFQGAKNLAAYAATKAALVQVTRNFAAEWAPHGIRVNAVAPGPIFTKFTAGIFGDPAYYAQLVQTTPLGRIGTPMDVAPAILFLSCSASSFITGQTLVIDGGRLAIT